MSQPNSQRLNNTVQCVYVQGQGVTEVVLELIKVGSIYKTMTDH